MSLVYGYDVKGYDDHFLSVARKMAELGGAVLPGTVLVNEVPLCEPVTQLNPRIDTPMYYSETRPRLGPVVEL